MSAPDMSTCLPFRVRDRASSSSSSSASANANANAFGRGPAPGCGPFRGQRGAVLPIALILMVLLVTSAAGLLRLIGASTDVARQVAFQRDAVNRGELAINAAIRQFEQGAGGHFASLANTGESASGVGSGLAYSATALPTDSQGVPLVLKSDSDYTTRFAAVLGTSEIDSGDSMRTRLVIDRLCSLEQPADANHCAVASTRATDQCSRCTSAGSPAVPVFRITARTRGARGIEAYVQTTFSVPFE